MFTTLVLGLALQTSDATPSVELRQDAANRRYAHCVVGRADEWAKSTEQAKVIVDTAVGACAPEKAAVELLAYQYLRKGVSSIPPRLQRETVSKMVGMVDDKVRNLAYQAIIRARTPKGQGEAPQEDDKVRIVFE